MKILVSGSSGQIGSEVAGHFDALGWEVHGIDNNMRADFFGPAGDTRWNQRRLQAACRNFTHHELDIRDRARLLELVAQLRPEALVHAAAQPSHDLAASRPFDDFDVNAAGTLNLLEGVRRFVLDSPNACQSCQDAVGTYDVGDGPTLPIHPQCECESEPIEGKQ